MVQTFSFTSTQVRAVQCYKDWNFAHTLPFAADYGFALEDSNYNQYFVMMAHPGQIRVNYTEIYVGWADNPVIEMAIPWSVIGSPSFAIHGLCAVAK